MISKTMEKRLNEQMREEFYSASIYLAMAAWCSNHDFAGGANFFKKQAAEELTHAMKFFDYLAETGAEVVVPGLQQPPAEYSSLLDVVEKALEHERYITDRIHKLVDLALEEKDHATNHFLQWFVDEQMEEEAHFSGLVAQIRMVGTDSRGLFLIDREMAKRQ